MVPGLNPGVALLVIGPESICENRLVVDRYMVKSEVEKSLQVLFTIFQ